MLGVAGITAIDTSVAGVTVKPVDPAVPPRLAVMVTDPIASDAARPFVPAALLTETTVVSDELQLTELVRSWVEWSV